MPIKLCAYPCLLTKDEKYLIVMFGRDVNGDDSPFIYVLDFTTEKWYTSKVSIPNISGYTKSMLSNGILMDESKLIDFNLFMYGYIRRLKLDLSYSFVPRDLVSIISKMYIDEYIHMFQDKCYNLDGDLVESSHFRIKLELVLAKRS